MKFLVGVSINLFAVTVLLIAVYVLVNNIQSVDFKSTGTNQVICGKLRSVFGLGTAEPLGCLRVTGCGSNFKCIFI
jgi:hypothetical protein